MKDELRKLQTWFEGLRKREQWLVGITFIVAILVLWDTFVFAPRSTDNKVAQSEIDSLNNRIANLESGLVPLRLTLQKDPDKKNKERIESLEKDLSELDQSIMDSSAYLVSPRQMAFLLEDILKQNNTLEEIRIQGLPPEPLYAAGTSERDENGREPLAYRQPLEIVFRGSFNDTQNYLKMVEALPWKYYWHSLVLQSEEYPEAIIMLRVNTLSLEREWIGG